MRHGAGDDARDLAPHRALVHANFAHLLDDGSTLTLADELAKVVVELVIGHAGHRDRRAVRFATLGQRDVQQLRSLARVLEEQLVEIAHPVEHERVRMLRLDAEVLEIAQLFEYNMFIDKGLGAPRPEGYQKIPTHFVYDIKIDGRHKARLVAGGHLTETPIDSVYSSVVSLRGIRLLTFIAEHNDLEVWSTDIGNAYLESFTQEKVYVIAGPEFGDRKGHSLVIVKALYGLKSSGLRWHERFLDVLRSMNFVQSKPERDIWMRDMGDHYEYIAVYVDDLLIVSRTPSSIITSLADDHKFKLKGTGAITFHLGCDWYCDDDGTLCYAPKKYLEKCMDNYRRLFGVNPKPAQAPLVKGDHPELDTSELLDADETQRYQSLIGSLQWVIQIGRC